MGSTNAERQARWRAKRAKEVEALRKAAAAPRPAPAAAAPPPSSDPAELQRLRQRLEEWEKFRANYEMWLDEADRIIKSRKGPLKKTTFNRIRFALHPDTYQNVDVDERNRLSQKLEELKLLLCNEAEMPTTKPKTPKLDLAEMLRRREEAKKTRRRKRVTE